MKEEVDLWIEENEPRGMIYNGNFYHVTKKKQVTYQTKSTIQEKTSPIDRGPKIGRKHHVILYKNITNEVKELIDSGKTSIPHIQQVLRKYYPKNKKSTLKTIAFIYRGYIEGKHQLEPVNQKKSFRKKRRRKKPKGTVGFEKSYQKYIKAQDVQNVKRAIRTVRYGYVPNTDTIEKETNIPRQQLLATLKYLKKKGQIISKRNSKKAVVYRLIE